MASFHTLARFLVTVAILTSAGCVVVNPSNVNVSGFNTAGHSGPPSTPYASALRDVIKQQGDVRTEINDREWADANDEIDDWVQYTRKLMGYADTSHDPAKFRSYCNELLTAIEQLRRSVNRHDAPAALTALNACDPILDRFSRDFPLTEPAAHAAPAENRSAAPSNSSSSTERKPPPRVP